MRKQTLQTQRNNRCGSDMKIEARGSKTLARESMRKGFLISIHTNKNKNHSSASIRSRGLAGFVRELSFFLVANWSLGLDLARARAGKCRQTEARAKPDLHNLSFGTQPENQRNDLQRHSLLRSQVATRKGHPQPSAEWRGNCRCQILQANCLTQLLSG